MKKSQAAVLNMFFRKEGQTAKEFLDEIRKLTPEEQHEMAELAAKELGVELE